jgi:hypothetical protein
VNVTVWGSQTGCPRESHPPLIFLFSFLMAALEFELRTLCLLGRCSYCLSHSSKSFFCDGFFRDRVLQTICPGLASNLDTPDLCLLSS